MVRLWKSRFVIVALLSLFVFSGCTVSREIVDLKPLGDQPPLQELESHLDYEDPDAGQPDYVRVEPE